MFVWSWSNLDSIKHPHSWVFAFASPQCFNRRILKGVYTVESCKPPLFGDSDKLIDFEGFIMDFEGFWSQNTKICLRKSRDVLFLKKKGPCQECPTPSSELVFTKNPQIKEFWQKNIIFRKGTRGKMTPQVFSIQCQSPFFIFSRHVFFLKEIAENPDFVFYLPIIQT